MEERETEGKGGKNKYGYIGRTGRETKRRKGLRRKDFSEIVIQRPPSFSELSKEREKERTVCRQRWSSEELREAVTAIALSDSTIGGIIVQPSSIQPKEELGRELAPLLPPLFLKCLQSSLPPLPSSMANRQKKREAANKSASIFLFSSVSSYSLLSLTSHPFGRAHVRMLDEP